MGDEIRQLVSDSYRMADWRNTLPIDDGGRIGLDFTLHGGQVIRLSLDRRSAQNIVATLTESLSTYEDSRFHSAMSYGMPIVDVPTPGEGE